MVAPEAHQFEVRNGGACRVVLEHGLKFAVPFAEAVVSVGHGSSDSYGRGVLPVLRISAFGQVAVVGGRVGAGSVEERRRAFRDAVVVARKVKVGVAELRGAENAHAGVVVLAGLETGDERVAKSRERAVIANGISGAKQRVAMRPFTPTARSPMAGSVGSGALF